jgi:hypothetical protein
MFKLPLTKAAYGPNLQYLRKAIALDRSEKKVSRVELSNTDGAKTVLFVRHSDVYITGLNFGGGDYYFLGEVAPDKAKRLEFPGSYYELGLTGGTVHLDAFNINQAVHDLATHKVTAQGSQFLRKDKLSLIRLLFVMSEALRFWTIQKDVQRVLDNPGTKLTINDYAGNGKPLNSWETWSKEKNWSGRGIMLPHPSCKCL